MNSWTTMMMLKMKNAKMYREAVSSLMYLSSCMQPDLSFVLSKLWQQFKEATLEHYRKNNQETKHCGTGKVTRFWEYKLTVTQAWLQRWLIGGILHGSVSLNEWYLSIMENKEAASCCLVNLWDRVHNFGGNNTRMLVFDTPVANHVCATKGTTKDFWGL